MRTDGASGRFQKEHGAFRLLRHRHQRAVVLQVCQTGWTTRSAALTRTVFRPALRLPCRPSANGSTPDCSAPSPMARSRRPLGRASRPPRPAPAARRHFPPAPEGVNVTDGTDQGDGRQLPDAGNRLQLLGRPGRRQPGPELAVDLGDAVLQGPALLPHAAEHAPQRRRQLRIQQHRNRQHCRLRSARPARPCSRNRPRRVLMRAVRVVIHCSRIRCRATQRLY